MKLRAVSALILSTVLYGMYGVYSRWIGVDFGIFTQNFTRNAIVAIIIFVFLLYKRSWQKVKRRDYKWLFLWIASGLISVISVFVAFNHIPIGTALFLFYAGSIVGGYFVGGAVFSEKLTRIRIIAIALSLLGMGIIYSSDIDRGAIGFISLALAAGLASGLWNSLSKTVSDKYSNSFLIFADASFNVVASVTLMLLLGESFPNPSINLPWLGIAAWATTQIIVVYLVIYGFRYLEAQLASLIMPLEVFFGALFGFVFFREVLNPLTIIGGLIILVGFALPHISLGKFNGV